MDDYFDEADAKFEGDEIKAGFFLYTPEQCCYNTLRE